MLEKLTTIDWSTVTHAYGPADDLPSLLLALAEPEPDDELIVELWHHICHQGSVYSASAAAVPFVAELTKSEHLSLTQRSHLLFLILMIGRSTDGETDDVDACRSAVQPIADMLIASRSEWPGQLWLPLSTFIIAAGETGRSMGLATVDEAQGRCGEFEAAGLAAIAESIKSRTVARCTVETLVSSTRCWPTTLSGSVKTDRSSWTQVGTSSMS